MKHYSEIPQYPIIRRSFRSFAELGEVINRRKSYISECMNGHKSFTDLEKRLILAAIGLPVTNENINLVFGGA